MKKRLIYLFVLLMAASFQGCFKLDSGPRLEILVVDQLENPVPGAYVALFETESEWSSRKNPVQVWRKTDAAGKVLFADLREIKYWIYARSGSLDNSLGEINTIEGLQNNKIASIVVHVR